MNPVESNINDKILSSYRDEGLLAEKSLDKLRKLMIKGGMTAQDWVSIFRDERTLSEEEQNED